MGISIYIFYFITLRHSHPQESSSVSFFFVGHLQTSRVEFQCYIFLDPQRGYVTNYWSRIRVLSSPSDGRPLAAVIINDCWIPGVYWYSETPVCVTYTHINFYTNSRNSVPSSSDSTLDSYLRLVVPPVPGSLGSSSRNSQRLSTTSALCGSLWSSHFSSSTHFSISIIQNFSSTQILSSTKFEFHYLEFLNSCSSCRTRFLYLQHRNSSSTELNRVPSSHNWIARNSWSVISDPPQRLPWDHVRICGCISWFFSRLRGNYLAPNLPRIWVPWNSAHSQYQESTVDLETPVVKIFRNQVELFQFFIKLKINKNK